MSSLADRLRGVLGSGPAKTSAGPEDPDCCAGNGQPQGAAPTSARCIAETLDGEWQEDRGHRYLVIDRKYGPGHRHGRAAIADAMPPESGIWPRLMFLGARVPCAGRLLFVDLETTGIAGGAGSYAFLVGCGWFDGATFRTRQFFLSSFGAEAALLDGVTALASDAAAVVTYNGKSFDLPLLETRFIMNRMDTPFAELPHVDMLHPARRLWKQTQTDAPAASASCRLTALERTQCGFEREGDVPGFEIPARYLGYVRSGDPRPLCAVFEHNRLDLISLALLTGRAAQLLDEGPSAAGNAREALGLGRLYEGVGLADEARACFARAVGSDRAVDPLTRVEALRAYAVSCRRARLYADAAAAWARILNLDGCPAHIAHEATEALSIHHEHRLRDPGAAKTFALRSLRSDITPSRQQALHYRLARLDRKIGRGGDTWEGRLFA